MSWTDASATVVPNTGPCRGRNCGKNENAKTAALGLAAIVTNDARNAAAGVRPEGRRVSSLEGRGPVWTLLVPPDPPQARRRSDEGRRDLRAPRKRAGDRE